MATSQTKEFATYGSKFFSLRVAPFDEGSPFEFEKEGKYNLIQSAISFICAGVSGSVRGASLTGDQEITGSTPASLRPPPPPPPLPSTGNILSWRLIMNDFLWSFFPFR